MHTRTHKKSVRFICLLCTLSFLFSLASCNGGNEGDESMTEVYYTVTFNTNGGSQIESIKVREGQYASRPEDPVLDNYVFRRWETDGREWHFETKKVTANMTLNALWISATELFSLEPDEKSGGLVITGFKKQASFSELKIPSVINGKTVVGIAADGMRDTHTDHAKKILIPDTVVSLGDNAFASTSEVELIFNGELTHIGEAAFRSCKLLKSVKLGRGVDKIPFMAFFECSSLPTINIPEGATVIEENAFEACTALRTAVLPSTLTSVQDSAFLNCTTLTSIFFAGTEDQFDAIEIADGNDALIGADVYFYSEEKPAEDGSYWHYEKGKPVIW